MSLVSQPGSRPHSPLKYFVHVRPVAWSLVAQRAPLSLSLPVSLWSEASFSDLHLVRGENPGVSGENLHRALFLQALSTAQRIFEILGLPWELTFAASCKKMAECFTHLFALARMGRAVPRSFCGFGHARSSVGRGSANAKEGRKAPRKRMELEARLGSSRRKVGTSNHL